MHELSVKQIIKPAAAALSNKMKQVFSLGLNSQRALSADLQAGEISFPSRQQRGRSGRGAAGSRAQAGRPSGTRAGTARWLLAWETWGSPGSSAPLRLQRKRGSETPSASNAPPHRAAWPGPSAPTSPLPLSPAAAAGLAAPRRLPAHGGRRGRSPEGRGQPRGSPAGGGSMAEAAGKGRRRQRFQTGRPFLPPSLPAAILWRARLPPEGRGQSTHTQCFSSCFIAYQHIQPLRAKIQLLVTSYFFFLTDSVVWFCILFCIHINLQHFSQPENCQGGTKKNKAVLSILWCLFLTYDVQESEGAGVED